MLVIKCFVERNFDLKFFYENIKTKNFLSCFVEWAPETIDYFLDSWAEEER